MSRPNWHTLPLTAAAQHVQPAAYPDAYAKHGSKAVVLVATILGVATDQVVACAAPVGERTQPVRGPITSGFRTPEHPDHDGVDISAPAGTPIRAAAAAGQVITARCDTDPSGQRCDQRGSPSTPGCEGWYVKIQHAEDVVTVYCDLVRRPDVHVGQAVTAGQRIGQVGSCDHSSDDHLHYEVGTPAHGSLDPSRFMRERGAALGH